MNPGGEIELLIDMYKRMVLIREFETAAIELFKRGKIKGTLHPSIGQEATAVGVCFALKKDDRIISTHRGHGHNIAKGADVKRMMAEILGKETGYCKGRGGSMHIAVYEIGSLGSMGVVGAGIPIAVGTALGLILQGKTDVVGCFFGDGAANTGNFHEGLNLAAIWRLPVLFVLENNRYAVSTPVTESVKIDDLSVRASAYGIPGARVNGFDVLAVYEETAKAVTRARNGEGPSLIVAESYRFEGHYAGEPQVYRDKAEIKLYREKDPIPRFQKFLVEKKKVNQATLRNVEADARREVEQAVEFAVQSPLPDAATAMEYIYA
ncbi:MAG: thiamine pyrophosphate-dependent dehydrogenase E1 component subunit alpha [Spirochaetota bacterium]